MKEKINNRKKQIYIIFIILIILIFFLSGFSMGKSFAKKDVTGKTEIAKPILQVENGSALEINNTTEKGIYEFKVKNYNEQGEITEVDLKYYIEILNYLNNEAIEIKLYRNEEEVEIKENKTEEIILTKDEIKEDNYKLEVKYNKDKNVNMEDIVEQLQIKVHSEQQEVL